LILGFAISMCKVGWGSEVQPQFKSWGTDLGTKGTEVRCQRHRGWGI